MPFQGAGWNGGGHAENRIFALFPLGNLYLRTTDLLADYDIDIVMRYATVCILVIILLMIMYFSEVIIRVR